MSGFKSPWFLGFKDITSSTNDADNDCSRYSHSSGVGDMLPLLLNIGGQQQTDMAPDVGQYELDFALILSHVKKCKANHLKPGI